MSLRVRIHPKALKELDRVRGAIRDKIIEDIRELARTFLSPSCRLDIKKLQGTAKKERIFRLRSGDHRVIFQAEKDTLWIARISHRDDAYEGMDR